MGRRTRQQQLAAYVRVHLVGAGIGIRLAEVLADDDWNSGALATLPDELADEVGFAKKWAASLSKMPELWVGPIFAATASARVVIRLAGPTRGRFRRVMALEIMRSLVLAKKAMWELGSSLNSEWDAETQRKLLDFDEQASRQAETLQRLHRRAAREAFESVG